MFLLYFCDEPHFHTVEEDSRLIHIIESWLANPMFFCQQMQFCLLKAEFAELIHALMCVSELLMLITPPTYCADMSQKWFSCADGIESKSYISAKHTLPFEASVWYGWWCDAAGQNLSNANRGIYFLLKICNWVYKERWINGVRHVKKGAVWRPSEIIKSDNDEQIKVVGFIGVTW